LSVADKEFNLLDEPWILALAKDGRTVELSLPKVLERAHELTALAGELPTQDVAVLRLLLAVLYSVFTRVDEHGNEAHLENYEKALARWENLWKPGRFPISVIKEYLEYYRERFYLFHPERPFYQVAGLSIGTDYRAAKLMGDLSESNNKVRLFPVRTGGAKKFFPPAGYGEAARWLLYLNAFDDTSSKPKGSTADNKLPSPGAGWLGKLGLVYVAGENLFETLLLNLPLTGENNRVWEQGEAVWEKQEVSRGQRTEIPLPRCPAELLTVQSRRLLLIRQGADIVGYKLLGGDFFSKENAFTEQMTIWRFDTKAVLHTPKRHDTAQQLWRGFAALTAKTAGSRQPGVVSWLSTLERKGLLAGKKVKIQAASVKYGDKDFFVDDVWGDALSVNASIFSQLGEAWVDRIIDLLQVTDDCVKTLGRLAADLAAAGGDKNGVDGKSAGAREEAYFRLDMPFRSWLSDIDPLNDDMEEASSRWKQRVRRIIFSLGQELAGEAGRTAFVGRTLKESRLVNTSKAYAKFKAIVRKVLK
jgi:CRISPR system Cascade subunit CasA